MDSRAQILGRLGHGSDIGRPAADERRPDYAERRTAFLERAREARCTTETVVNLANVADAVRRYLDELGFSGPVQVAPDLRDRLPTDALERGIADLDPAADGLAVIASCIAGVAETGTLAVTSGGGTDPRLYYLAETLVVLLAADRVVGRYEEVWPLARAAADGLTPRLVSFVTGPSRTADIEQTIEFGAHGARQVHVVLVEEGL